MLKFEFLAARHGDCVLVHWDHDRLMLVDGGPEPVYCTTLRPHLSTLAHAIGLPLALEVVCVTHVDDDHIAGVLQLLREMRRTRRDGLPEPFAIKRIWHNSVEELVDAAAPGLAASVQPIVNEARADAVVGASYTQGQGVRDDAAALGLAGNTPFRGPITAGASATIGGLTVSIVAPNLGAVEQLAEKWREAKQSNDGSVIAQAYRDRSVPNLSSISMHLRYATFTALLTGDALGKHVLTGLEETGLVPAGGRLHVDVLQVPHHGSHNNVERAFFEHIWADHYVLSADGIKHHHPSEETLAWIVESRGVDDGYTVHLTNEIPFAQRTLEHLQQSRRFGIENGPTKNRPVTIDIGA
jgi:hypothetical protein